MTRCDCGLYPPHEKENPDHAMTVILYQLRIDRERQDREAIWSCIKCGAGLNQETMKTDKEPRFGKMRIHRRWKCEKCGEINHKIHFENVIN